MMDLERLDEALRRSMEIRAELVPVAADLLDDLDGVIDAARAYRDFPTDEDVEVAAEGIKNYLIQTPKASLSFGTPRADMARAALQAIADTRRTEEE